MKKQYAYIPTQGEHRKASIQEEVTTSVRAQQPSVAPERSKATRFVHVLSVNRKSGQLRLRLQPIDAVALDPGFEEVVRAPEGGNMERLFGHIPKESQHAVFESTASGRRDYRDDRRLRANWADAGTYDQVTLFSDATDAESYAEAVKSDSAAR